MLEEKKPESKTNSIKKNMTTVFNKYSDLENKCDEEDAQNVEQDEEQHDISKLQEVGLPPGLGWQNKTYKKLSQKQKKAGQRKMYQELMISKSKCALTEMCFDVSCKLQGHSNLYLGPGEVP